MRFQLFFKALSIGAVLLVIGLVLMRIGFLVDERAARQREAVAGVEQSHAGAQTVVGPLLLRPCTEEWETAIGEGKERQVQPQRRAVTATAVPATLEAQGRTRADERRRGLFKVHSYGAELTLAAGWTAVPALQPERRQPGSRLHCGAPVLSLGLSDVRGVRLARVEVDGVPHTVRPGAGDGHGAPGLHVVLPPERTAAGAPMAVQVVLELAGTGELALVPSAEATRWQLQSDWPHPSFGGRFLPAEREIRPDGFTARWSVSALASSAPAALQRSGGSCPGASAGGPRGPAWSCLDTLSVAFFDPVNPHVLSDRAIKYGLLFVVLTFVAVALVEVLSGRRVHPVQYLLVGLALCVFFLLLLSLSEHWPFGRAYAAAATSCAVLLGYYGAHMLGRRTAGLAFGAAIAGLYGLLYLLLQMEQNALVIGSVGLFAALAAAMVATRRLDWYALSPWRRDDAPA